MAIPNFEDVDYSKFTKCKAICQAILQSLHVGERTTFEQTHFLIEFFIRYHPQWKTKTQNAKVLYFEKHRANEYTSCFHLFTENGIEDDISYSKLRKKDKNIDSYKRKNIERACRSAIDVIIKPIREKAIRNLHIKGFILSELSGKYIRTQKDIHVDHFNLTFIELVDRWIELKGLDFLFSQINIGERNSTVTRFTNPYLIEEFIKFHNNNTHLRIISGKENLSLTKNTKLSYINS